MGVYDGANTGLRSGVYDNAATPAPVTDNTDLYKLGSSFSRGFDSGVVGNAATVKAFVASALGRAGFRDAAQNVYDSAQQDYTRQSAMAQASGDIQDYRDVHNLRQALNYGLNAAGQGVSSTIPAFVGTGIGGALTRSGLGAYLGGAAAMTPMEGGETVLQAKNDPNLKNMSLGDLFPAAATKGVTNAMLEEAVPYATTHRMFHPGAGGTILSRMGKATAESTLGEGLTEGTQQEVGNQVQNALYSNQGLTRDTSDDVHQDINNALMGAAGGALMGGAGQAVGEVGRLPANVANKATDVAGNATNAATDAAKTGLGKLPSVDQAIEFGRYALNNPTEFGGDIANMGLSAFDKAKNGADWAQQKAALGVSKLESYAKDFDTSLTKAIAQSDSIKNPENKLALLELKARARRATVGDWGALKSIMSSENIGDAVTTAAGIGGAKAQQTVDSAQKVGGWLKDLVSGASARISEGKKASLLGLSESDKYNLAAIKTSPDLQHVNTWLSGQDAGTRNAFVKLLSHMQNNQLSPDEQLKFAATMQHAGINPMEVHEHIQKSFATAPESLQNKVEQSLTANSPQSSLSREHDAAQEDIAGLNQEGEQKVDPDLDHHVVQKFLQRHDFRHQKESSIPFLLRGVDENGKEIDPKSFFQHTNPDTGEITPGIFQKRGSEPDKEQGKKVGGKWKAWKDTFGSHGPEDMDFGEHGRARVHLNPMSMVNEATNPANKEHIRDFLPARGETESNTVRKGRVFDSLFGNMLDKGFTATHEGKNVHVQMKVDPSFSFDKTDIKLDHRATGPVKYSAYTREQAKSASASSAYDKSRLNSIAKFVGWSTGKDTNTVLDKMVSATATGNKSARTLLTGLLDKAEMEYSHKKGVVKNDARDIILNAYHEMKRGGRQSVEAYLERMTASTPEGKTAPRLLRELRKGSDLGHLTATMGREMLDVLPLNVKPLLTQYLKDEASQLRSKVQGKANNEIVSALRDELRDMEPEKADALLQSALVYAEDYTDPLGKEFGDFLHEVMGDKAISVNDDLSNALEELAFERSAQRATDTGLGGTKMKREDYMRKATDEWIPDGEQEPNDAPDVRRADEARADSGTHKLTPTQQVLKDHAAELKDTPHLVLNRNFDQMEHTEQENAKTHLVKGAFATKAEALKQLRAVGDENYKYAALGRQNEVKQSKEQPKEQAREQAKEVPDHVTAEAKNIVAAKRDEIAKLAEKLFGKRVAVVFTRALQEGVSGEYSTVKGQAPEKDTTGWTGKEKKDYIKQLNQQRRAAIKAGELDRAAELEIEASRAREGNAVLGVIRLSADFDNLATVFDHESLHAAFDIFFTPEERRTLVKAFTDGVVMNKVKAHFNDQAEVLKQIDKNPEEALAYGFQLYVANPDLLRAGPKVDTLFGKLKNWFKKVFELMTPQERAAIILDHFLSGERSQKEVSPVARVLERDMTTQQKVAKYAKGVGGALWHGFNVAFENAYNRLEHTDNPALQQIARLAYKATGTDGKNGMIQNWETNGKKLVNDYAKLTEKYDADTLREAHKAMVLELNRNQIGDPKVAAAVADHDQFLADMLRYQQKAGMKIGKINEHYFPLLWNSEKVAKDRTGFIDMLNKPEYADKLKTLNKTPHELADDIISELDRGGDFQDILGGNGEPVAQSAKSRTLGFIDPADRQPFVNDDLHSTMMTYILQASRKAEFTRAFGNDGTDLARLRNEAEKTYGATPDEMGLAKDYMDGILGNRETGMSRELRDSFGTIIAYENWRLLPLNLFSSIVDPLGIAVRTNSVEDAWNAFTYSMKNLFRDLKDREDVDKDFWERLSEDWGIIDRHGVESNIHHMYESVSLRGLNSSANEMLFKYNLVNGWTKSTKIMAVAAANRFMARLKEGKMFKPEQTARYLEELNLSADDIHLDANGDVMVHPEDLEAAGVPNPKQVAEKMRQASMTVVNQSILNPNAAEKPVWGSNPYFALMFQLKSFAFAFQQNILGRIMHEAKHGNAKPAFVAGLYIPVAIGSDMIKGLISGWGSEPPWKEDWTAGDYLMYGWQRSGLTGIGAFFDDMHDDMMHGGHGYESFAGPAFGQASDAAHVAFGTGSGRNLAVKSLPLAPLFEYQAMDTSNIHSSHPAEGASLGTTAASFADDLVFMMK